MLAAFRYPAVILVFAALAPLHAQPSRGLGDATVTLVAGTAPLRGGRVEVVRRASRSPQNVVIVDRKATAEDLAGAVVMINELRIAHGDSLTMDFRARAESVHPGPGWQSSAYRGWIIAQLARLRSAPEQRVAGLGVVRAVRITLPAPKEGATRNGG